MTSSATSELQTDGDRDFALDEPGRLSPHEEMLRQDRRRLVSAGLLGCLIAGLLIAGAAGWVVLQRTARGESTTIVETEPTHIGRAEQPLSLSPQEVLTLSKDTLSETPKRVSAERIQTKVD